MPYRALHDKPTPHPGDWEVQSMSDRMCGPEDGSKDKRTVTDTHATQGEQGMRSPEWDVQDCHRLSRDRSRQTSLVAVYFLMCVESK